MCASLIYIFKVIMQSKCLNSQYCKFIVFILMSLFLSSCWDSLCKKGLPRGSGQRVRLRAEDNARGASSIPGLGRSPGGENGYLLQSSCLENPMDRGAWWVTVHGIAQSRTRLKQLRTGTCAMTTI